MLASWHCCPVILGIQKKKLVVSAEKNKASNTLTHGLVMLCFLHQDKLELTNMKKAPRHPQMHPQMMAPGKVNKVGGAMSTVPNLSVEDVTAYALSPSIRSLNMAKLNTAMAHVKKTFQRTENFQKLLGLEIS